MKNDNNVIAAIDIGTTKIVAIVGKKIKDKGFEIIGFGTAPSNGMRRGVVYNVDDTIMSIRLALDKANEKLDTAIRDVFVGIAGQHISSIKNRCKLNLEQGERVIEEYDLIRIRDFAKETIGEPSEEVIDIIPQSYIVDDKLGIENPLGMTGSILQANFYVILGKMSLLKNIKQCVFKSGLGIKTLFLEPLASAEAVLSPKEKKEGVVLVDIGGGTTDLAIYQDGKVIHTAVIPVGGKSITHDIQTYFFILEQQAEDLKLKYGSAIQEKSQEDVVVRIKGLKGREDRDVSVNELSQVIQSRMEEILHALMFQIEFAGIKDKLPAGIVITGGGALLKNLKHLATLITKNDIRIAFPSECVIGDYAETINKPQYSTSIGLLILGYKYNIKQIELNNILEKLKTKEETEKVHEEEIQEEEIIEPEQTKDKHKGKNFIDRIKNSVINLLDDE